MALCLVVNGGDREYQELAPGSSLTAFVETLGFRPDRVAIERNGAIVPRTEWPQSALNEGDKLEVVHFVGGGAPCHASCTKRTMTEGELLYQQKCSGRCGSAVFAVHSE